MILNGTILDADVNASAAIAGTKISPDFGSQNVTTTGTSTAASFIPSSATVPTNGLYLSAANTVALATNSTGKVFVDSSGNLSVGTSAVASLLNLRKDANSTGPGNSASIVLTNKNTTLNGSIASGIFADCYRDIQDPSYTGGIWFTRNSEIGNASSSSDIVFGAGQGSSFPPEIVRFTKAGTVNIVGAGTAGSTQAVSFNVSAPIKP
jgi:hypothetical protein